MPVEIGDTIRLTNKYGHPAHPSMRGREYVVQKVRVLAWDPDGPAYQTCRHPEGAMVFSAWGTTRAPRRILVDRYRPFKRAAYVHTQEGRLYYVGYELRNGQSPYFTVVDGFRCDPLVLKVLRERERSDNDISKLITSVLQTRRKRYGQETIP